MAFVAFVALDACSVDETGLAGASPALPIDCSAPVKLSSVTVQGFRDKSACAYKGIAFARQPVGDLRFRAPRPLAGNQGRLLAGGFGADCVQAPTFRDVPIGEACLYLNVYIPGETADGALAKNTPVMVFFYGGGFVSGGASWAFYDGEPLTTHGVIVVTVNYRLGPFGYLAPSAVTDADGAKLAGNLGLRDQTQALRWVQENIAGFGGDPTRVTIFGESAGAWSVCDLMASTETAGLFHRAIMESGECMVGSRADTAAKADQWIAKTGCPVTGPTAMACLRALDASDLPSKYPYSMGGGMVPNVDGTVLPDQPITRLRAGVARKIPLIAGSNREETEGLRLFPSQAHYVQQTFPEFWAQAAHALTPSQIDRVRDLYGDTSYTDPMALITAMLDDIIFACPAYDANEAQVARGAPAWRYRFSMGTGENVIEPFTGSSHGIEIPYVFGDVGLLSILYPNDAALRRMHELSERAQRYWSRFAATGDPNGPGDPHWPGFGESHSRMELSVDAHVTRGLDDGRCAFWGAVAPIGLGERFDFIKQLVGFNPIDD